MHFIKIVAKEDNGKIVRLLRHFEESTGYTYCCRHTLALIFSENAYDVIDAEIKKT